MKKEVMYTYLGTNGTITSPVHIEDTYYIRKIALHADVGKILSKDGKNFKSYVLVPEEEIGLWKEYDVGQDELDK